MLSRRLSRFHKFSVLPAITARFAVVIIGRDCVVLSNWTYLIDIGGSSFEADGYRFVGGQSISLAHASPG